MMEKIREKAKRFFALSDVDSIQIIIFQPHFSKVQKLIKPSDVNWKAKLVVGCQGVVRQMKGNFR